MNKDGEAMNNIVLVNLESTYASAYGIWQWDYGQILRIQSKKKLPKAVEVHFSEQEKGGSSITRIGTTADNVTDVPIPDSLLEKSGKIYAFVYIEDGQSGNTEYKIEMSVKARPKPEIPGTPEEPELFKETIKAVNDAADRAETAERNAKDSASKAEEAAASASASAKAAENTKTEALEEIGNKKQDALSAIQTQKEESLSAIRTQEENSVSKVTEHTNEEIQRFQNAANESKGALDWSIEEAGEKKTSLDSSIQTADSSKANLDESIQNAGSAKSGLDASTGKAKDAKTELDGSIQTAGEKQAALDTIVGKAEELDTSLAKNIESGTQLQKELVASGEKAVQDIQSAGTEQLDKMQTVADEFEADREQVNVNKENIASLTEDLSNKITKFYASNQGNTHLPDSDKGKIQDMLLYGKSLQDGTPSPENPVEIKSVVNPTIKLLGSNILKIMDGEYQESGITVSYSNGVVKLKGTANANLSVYFDVNLTGNKEIAFKEGTEIIFSPNKVKGMEESNNVYLDLTNNKTIGFSIINNNINTPYIIRKEDSERPFILAVRISTGINYDETWKPQILIGKTITAFKPYIEQTVTLPITLNAIPVSSGGNVTIDGQQYIADYVDVERGKLVRMCKEVDFAEFTPISYTLNPERISEECRFSYEQLGIKQIDSSITYSEGAGYIDHLCLKVGGTWGVDEIGIFAHGQNTDAKQMSIRVPLNTGKKTKEYFENIGGCKGVFVATTSEEIDLTPDQIQAFKSLATNYPVTNIEVSSDQLDGYTVFNYPISMANGWNYVKQQIGDTRDYIYDMDLQSAEAYVNSEYAVALAELEVM